MVRTLNRIDSLQHGRAGVSISTILSAWENAQQGNITQLPSRHELKKRHSGAFETIGHAVQQADAVGQP
jgi:hypothetical protein